VVPNPASEYIRIQGDFVDSDYLDFQLIDLSGRLLLSETCLVPDIGNIIQIDTAGLDAGTYLVRLYSQSKTGTKPIIIH
jgi:hypothetical protein